MIQQLKLTTCDTVNFLVLNAVHTIKFAISTGVNRWDKFRAQIRRTLQDKGKNFLSSQYLTFYIYF